MASNLTGQHRGTPATQRVADGIEKVFSGLVFHSSLQIPPPLLFEVDHPIPIPFLTCLVDLYHARVHFESTLGHHEQGQK